MRKDIFLVGIRLLGILQLCGAMVSLVFLIGDYAGYVRAQSPGHEYTLLRFGVELIIGLLFISRPQNIFNLVNQLSVPEDEDKSSESDTNEEESATK
jgi:hypothetical protein